MLHFNNMANLFGKLTRTLGWGPNPTKVSNINIVIEKLKNTV